MPTDGAIAKFLYAILKQLDLKSVRGTIKGKCIIRLTMLID